MSFELLKEIVAFVSALVSLLSALSSGRLIRSAGYSVDPLKWGALCFSLGAAFAVALLLALSKQRFYPIEPEPLVQWGGFIGFLGAVLGLVSALLIRKEVSEAQTGGQLPQQTTSSVMLSQGAPQPIYNYIRYPSGWAQAADWTAVFVFAMLFGTIAFIALLIFIYNMRHY